MQGNWCTKAVEQEPGDVQQVVETTYTAIGGTHIHLARSSTIFDDTPRIATSKEKPTLQNPSCTYPPCPNHQCMGGASRTHGLQCRQGRGHSQTSEGSMPCSSTEQSGHPHPSLKKQCQNHIKKMSMQDNNVEPVETKPQDNGQNASVAN